MAVRTTAITLLTLAFHLLCASAHAAVWYVDKDNTSTQNGISWATAYSTIQTAVDAAFTAGGGEVWVSAGTYTGTTDPILTMKEGVAIYGGFAGTETAREQRNWTANLTAIDGENARRCVNGANNATLDGFTITRGEADSGGGMCNSSASPTISNCTFFKNSAAYSCYGDDYDCMNEYYRSRSGGGMSNYSCSPTITNCTFSENFADGGGAAYGGGIYNYESSLTITNCSISKNSASGGFCAYGGGMYNSSSSSTITNCKFSENSALFGGGMSNFASSPTIINCTLSGNHDGGMFNDESSSPTITNCIIWEDTGGAITNNDQNSLAEITYSCTEGGHVGTGNIYVDPLFVDAANGDLRLSDSSPCIDSGTSANAPSEDIRGVPRPLGSGIDMGAYEYEGDVIEGQSVDGEPTEGSLPEGISPEGQSAEGHPVEGSSVEGETADGESPDAEGQTPTAVVQGCFGG